MFDVAQAGGYTDIRFLDDASPDPRELFGCPVTRLECFELSRKNPDFIIAIGNNRVRARCYERGIEQGWNPITLTHPAATISPNSKIGLGSVVMAGAVVNAGSIVGRNCIINTGAIVEHDCRVFDHVHLSPSATLAGNVVIGELTHVGMGASVLPGVRVGKNCTVGAGAVVLKEVAPDTKVVGVPARPLLPPKKLEQRPIPTQSHNPVLLSIPHMSGREQDFVNEAFQSNWLSTVGPNISQFEREFGAKLGVSAVALSSGTAAIHLGLRALGVGPGDTVFCSDFTFVASANPILYLGAKPVFIDSEPESWNMDPHVLAGALQNAAKRNELPKAVIVVHLFGQCADMDPIMAACSHYGVPVLEDAAEALGANYKGRPAGTLGDIAAFSFNGNKIITTTGGGMLVSREEGLVAKAQFWATQARDPGIAYHHHDLGYNYRMSNVLAGIGRGQLLVLDERVEQRRAIAFRYAAALANVPGISFMPQASYGLHTNWLSCFLIDEKEFGCSRDELVGHLDKAAVESRPVWKPMHMQPLYKSAVHYGGEVCANLFRRGICLPSSSNLKIEDQAHVVESVIRASFRTNSICNNFESPALSI